MVWEKPWEKRNTGIPLLLIGLAVLGIGIGGYILYKYIQAPASSTNNKMAGNDNKRGFKTKPWMTFNGTSDFVSIPSSSKLQLQRFTVSCWFKTSKDYTIDGIDGMIVNKGGTGGETGGKNQNYGIRVFKTTNKIRAGFETRGGTDHEPASPNTVNDGKWHHCVSSYNGSKVKLYMEGVLVATDSTSSTPDYTNTQPLVIGRNSHDATRWFKGDVDGIKIWNRAISDSEVKAEFEGNMAGVSRSGLVYESFS